MAPGPEQATPNSNVQETLRFNADVYRNYYSNPLQRLRYELLYRAKRIADLLSKHGVDVTRPGFAAYEYGFGAGHLLSVVAGASEVVAMEASPSAVMRARAMMPPDHPHWEISEHADATHIPLESARFDLVTASHVLEHLPDDEAALREWLRLLRPGGHLLLLLPSNEVLFPGSKHLRVYEVGALCERLTRMGLQQVAVDEHQRFDRPFKHRNLVLLARKSGLVKTLVDAPRTLLFLPPQLVSWRLLSWLDAGLGLAGAPSSSIAYLFRKP